MTTYKPEYRLTLFQPRSADATEATILTPISGSVHADYFRVTTQSVADNVCVQPGFEVGTAGTLAVTGATLSKSNTNVFEGSFALKVTTADLAGSGVAFLREDGSTRFALNAGETWTWSAYIFGTGGAIGKAMLLQIAWFDENGVTAGLTSTFSFTIASGWNRVSLTAVANPGAKFGRPGIFTNGAIGVFDFWVDNQQFEKASVASAFTNYRPYLGHPRGRTGRVNVLDRTTDVGTMSFDIHDVALVPGVNANRWASAFLGNANGDPTLGGVKCFVEESIDGGVNWTPYFTGYVKTLALEGRRGYKLTVRDMTYELTKMPLFQQPPHTSISYAGRPLLMPLGMTGTFGTLVATADLTATVVSPVTVGGSTLANVARVNMSAASMARKDNFVTRNLLSSVAADTRQNTNIVLNAGLLAPGLPNFKGPCRAHLTWNGGANQGDFQVGQLGLAGYQATGGNLGLGMPFPSNFFGHASVSSFCIKPLEDTTDLGYSALPSNGTAVSIRLFVDYKMDEGAALLIDVANPLTMLADVLNGKFSGIYRSPEKLPTGKVYGDVRRAFTHTISSSNQPELAPLRLVIDKPVENALEWVQKELLKPFGLALVVNGAGSFSVVDMRLPTGATIGSLVTITDSDVVLGEVPTWEYDREQAIFKCEGTIWEDFVFQLDELKGLKDRYPEFGKLLLASIDHPQIPLAIGSNDFGDKIWKMGGDGYRFMAGDANISNTDRNQYLQDKQKEQFDLIRRPFAFGATYLTLPCRRTSIITGLVQGQNVKVNVSTVPNPSSRTRGGVRICRIVELTRDPLRTNVRLLDLGLEDVAGTPTLGSPALGSDPRHTATISVTLNSGIPAEIRIALTDGGVAPSNTSAAWHYWEGSPVLSSQTITITRLYPGKRLWVQARSMPVAHQGTPQMPSDWVTSTGLDLTAYTAPTVPVISNITARTATVSWTQGSSDLWIAVGLRSPDSGAYTTVAILLPTSTRFNLVNLTPNTVYGVEVKYFSVRGFVSGAISTSFTTLTTDTVQPPRPPFPRRFFT